MSKPSTCHPERPRMFSDRNASSWERGLCAQCHAQAKKTRAAQREIVNRKMRTPIQRVRAARPAFRVRSASATVYQNLIVMQAKARRRSRGIDGNAWAARVKAAG